MTQRARSAAFRARCKASGRVPDVTSRPCVDCGLAGQVDAHRCAVCWPEWDAARRERATLAARRRRARKPKPPLLPCVTNCGKLRRNRHSATRYCVECAA